MINRQQILSIFEQNKSQPQLWKNLKQQLDVKSNDFLYFKKTMQELFSELILIQSHGGEIYLNDPDHLKVGIVNVNRKGFGFVKLILTDPTINTTPESYFVNPFNLADALNGDEVFVQLFQNPDSRYDKLEAKILKVKTRKLQNIVGLVCRSYKGNFYLKINNINLQQYRTTINNSQNVKLHHFYEAKLVNFQKGVLLLELTTDLGHEIDVGIDILAVVKEFGIDDQFNESVLEQSRYLPDVVTEEELTKQLETRTDFRDLPLVTIDGNDSKDFDDAICVTKLLNGHYQLTVAIADVAHYVHQGTPLDETAMKRGFSVYLINKVIPMLPEKLSNGICSLNPNVPRLCMVCVMEFNQQGQLVKSHIKEGVMRSHARLTYDQVNTFFQNQTLDQSADIKTMLQDSKTLYELLWANKAQAGFMEFSLKEPKFILGDNQQIKEITYRVQHDAEKLIEAFMVAANETVAATVLAMDKPFVYRNHDKPKLEKLTHLTNQLSSLGYEAHFQPTTITAKDIQKVMNELAQQNVDLNLMAPIFLRSMEKATYNNYNIGHFGLASTHYTHFTSPIRRYSDLIVHRYLKQYILKHQVPVKPLTLTALSQICDGINKNELITTDCERAVNQMKMAEYMTKMIGQEFTGKITTVARFGIFVQLPNLIEGLVHIKDLNDDYYTYDETHFALTGANTKRRFQIGQKITIKVLGADKRTRKIDFGLA